MSIYSTVTLSNQMELDRLLALAESHDHANFSKPGRLNELVRKYENDPEFPLPFGIQYTL